MASRAIQSRYTAPRVSVITPFFNAGRFLAEAIQSVLEQEFSDLECILVDDGSTDSSSDVAQGFVQRHPEKVKCFYHPGHTNRGVCASRNLGLEHARGDLIALLDSDDVWEPNKLHEQVKIMDDHSELAMVCGAAKYWDSWEGGADAVVKSGHVQGRITRPPETTLNVYPLGPGPAPCPSDLLIKTSVAKAIGGFEESFVGTYQIFEDQAFLAKLYLTAPVYFSESIWLKYRLHDMSCTSSVAASGKKSEARQYFFRWFASYLKRSGNVDRRVLEALNKKRRFYRDSEPLFPRMAHTVRDVFSA